MPVAVDPNTIQPTAGHMLVEVVESLGGLKKGSRLYVPETASSHDYKDKAICRVIRVGPSPWEDREVPVKEGDMVILPRDIPLMVFWEERRYGLAIVREIIAVIDGWEGQDVVPAVDAYPVL